MRVQASIESKLQNRFRPVHLEVLNESHMHSVPPGSESHFKVTVVSAEFADQKLINRHRMINQLLAEEFANGLHALALHTLTPDEWSERGGKTPDSPLCLGGSKSSSS